MATRFVRQDAWALEEEQPWHPVMLAYARAVAEMQKRPKTDPLSWDYQAAVHGTEENPDQWRNQCQHNSWYFFPWHRMYLYWFERIVRSVVVGLPDIDDGTKTTWALPYWDYDRSQTTRALPPSFWKERTLPTGEPNPLRVEQRTSSLNAGGALPPEVTSAGVALTETVFSMDLQPGVPAGFGGPRTQWHHAREDGIATPGALERTPHGDVHSEVGGPGGLMSGFDTAPRDPIFWFHHANIDRLWVVWLTHFGGANPGEAPWLDEKFHFHDERGQDITRQPRGVLDTLADLGYEYADVSAPAGLEVVPVAPGPAPEHPAELVGATEQPVELTGDVATTVFAVGRPTGPLAETAEAAPSRVYLNVENIEAEQNPGVSYGVYVNVPDEDDDPTNDAHHVGNVSFFGIEVAQDVDREHADGHAGLRYAFDITDLYQRLKAEGRWDESRLKVTFAPLRVVPPPGVEAVGEIEATPPAKVGRVSLFFQ